MVYKINVEGGSYREEEGGRRGGSLNCNCLICHQASAHSHAHLSLKKSMAAGIPPSSLLPARPDTSGSACMHVDIMPGFLWSVHQSLIAMEEINLTQKYNRESITALTIKQHLNYPPRMKSLRYTTGHAWHGIPWDVHMSHGGHYPHGSGMSTCQSQNCSMHQY